MITGINESKRLTEHISCEYKCKFDGRECNSNQKRSNNKYQFKCKNPKLHRVCEKDYVWDPVTCSCKIGKHLASINDDDSVVTCDEIIE